MKAVMCERPGPGPGPHRDIMNRPMSRARKALLAP